MVKAEIQTVMDKESFALELLMGKFCSNSIGKPDKKVATQIGDCARPLQTIPSTSNSANIPGSVDSPLLPLTVTVVGILIIIISVVCAVRRCIKQSNFAKESKKISEEMIYETRMKFSQTTVHLLSVSEYATLLGILDK